MKVGIIGVGTMGSRMSQNIIAGGHILFARDKEPKAAENVKQMGAKICGSPKEVAQNAEIVLMSLPLPQDVKEVVAGEEGILAGAKAGLIIVDLSTVDPFTTQENARLAKQAGVGYIDAPVLGRPQKCGNWTLPIGGEEQNLAKISPVLQLLAKKVIYVGPSGHGNIIKVLNNMMFGAINSITAEIMAMSAKLGMKPETLYNTIAESGAASVSNLFIELGPKMISADYSPLFKVELLRKDVALGIKMAKELGVPLFVSEANQRVNEIAFAKGWGDEDTSAVVKLYEELYGVDVTN